MHPRRSLSQFALMLVLATPIASVVILREGATPAVSAEQRAAQPIVTQTVIAQTIEQRKAEADGLLQQGIQQYQVIQFEAALQSWQQSLKLYREIKNRRGEGQSLGNLGLAYDSLGNYVKAIEFHEQSLAIAREIKDRSEEGRALTNLGNVYQSLKNYPKAIEFQQKSLEAFREAKDQRGVGRALINLGNIQKSLKNYSEAIKLYNQSLSLSREVKDQVVEGRALLSLGILYESLNDHLKSIEFYEKSLSTSRKIKDQALERTALIFLGGLYRSLNNYSKAIYYQEQRLTIALATKNLKEQSDVLNSLGLDALLSKDYEKAIEYQKRHLYIARELKDRQDEKKTLSNLGLLYNLFRNLPESIRYYEQELEIARSIKDKKDEGDILYTLGRLCLVEFQDYLKAIEYYERSLLIVRQIQDRKREAIILDDLGSAYHSIGNYPKAIAYHQQGLVIAYEIKDSDSEGKALLHLGTAYRSIGDYPKAIEYHQKRLLLAIRLKNREGEGAALGNLGITYHELGSHAKAIEFQEQSLAIARELKDRQGEGYALGNLGSLYISLKNYPKAIEYQEQTLVIVRELKDRRGEASTLGNLGVIYNDIQNYAKAIEYQERSLLIKRELKDQQGEGSSLGNLGKTYYALGNYTKAIDYQEKFLAIARDIKDLEGEYKALNNLGFILTKREPELAIIFYKQSVNTAELLRQSNRILSRDLQSSYTKTVAGTYRGLADLLLSQGRVLEAQQVLELLKIQELRDFTKDTRAGGPTEGSPLNPLEQLIPGAYTDKIALGSQLTQCEQTKCAQRSQLIAQREAANDKFTALVDRLKKALREQEIKDPAQLQNDRFTLAAQNVILANPKVKTVLVYPLVLDDKLWLVWGGQAGKAAVVFDSKEVPISRKDLSAKVGELQDLLSKRGDPQKLQQVSQQLYQWLIAPIRKQLDDNGVQQIVFSLDRATRYIPMAALHDGKQFLIENFAISTILTAEIDTKDKLSANLQDDPVLGLGLTQAVSGFPALAAVRAEIDGIIRTPDRPQDANGIYPGLELFDRNFTETALREKVSDYRILHIATHGKFVPGNPEDSFLVLGDGRQLSIPTIRSMTALANTHLVVLSACETGKGGIDKEGLEVAGIGHYFLLSGAKSVMASLWLVNDPATSLLMREFYSRLSKGNISKAEALRQVQIEFLKGKLTAKDAPTGSRDADVTVTSTRVAPKPADFSHPYYWAPFILIGNSL